MSRARLLLAGLVQLVIGASSVQAGIVASRYVLVPALVSAFSLDVTGAAAVRRIVIFVMTVAAYWAFVHWYERRAVPELHVTWRALLSGAAAGALSIGAAILLLSATGHYRVDAIRGLAGASDVLGVIAVAALIEEVFFRGLLFRILEERIGTRWALAASALVFSVAHFANDGFTPMTVIAVAFTGLMWAGVYIASRSLWVAAAHHTCWNATIFLSGLPLSGQEEWRAQAPLVTEYTGAALWTGGAFGPEDSLVSVVLTAMACAALWRIARATDASFPRPPIP